MEEGWITAQCGLVLESMQLYGYAIPHYHIATAEKRERFSYWLRRKSEAMVFDVDQIQFFTLEPLPEKIQTQFRFTGIHDRRLDSMVAEELKNKLAGALDRHFEKLGLKKHSFPYLVTKSRQAGGVAITHYMSYRLEILSGGAIMLKWWPGCKMQYHGKPLSTAEFLKLKSTLPAPDGGILINEITPSLKSRLLLMHEKLTHINWPAWLPLSEKVFTRIVLKPPLYDRNLLIGKDREGKPIVCRKQSAVFFNGIYRPVHHATIVPVDFGTYGREQFEQTLTQMNTGGIDFRIEPPVQGIGEVHKVLARIREQQPSGGAAVLLALFTRDDIPAPLFRVLRKHRLMVFRGVPSAQRSFKAQLSNFSGSCLAALGGMITALGDSGELNRSCFLSVYRAGRRDVERNGHIGGVALANCRGELIWGEPVSEKKAGGLFSSANVMAWTERVKEIFEHSGGEGFDRLIVHLSCKITMCETRLLARLLQDATGVDAIDIVVITGDHTPLVAGRDPADRNQVLTPPEGWRWVSEKGRYGLLFTNTQARQTDGMVSPVELIHIHGSASMEQLVEQVYWLSLVETGNLFFGSRLPCTLRYGRDMSQRHKRFIKGGV